MKDSKISKKINGNYILNEFKILKVNPCLKYKEIYNIINNGERFNEIFEVFKSIKDEKEYLLSPDYKTNKINVISLNDNKIIKSLETHESHITSIRYFVNIQNNKEFFVSTDQSNIVIIWDISNDYKIKSKIETNYNDYILSCLLIFNINSSLYKNYLVTSCSCNGFTKLYDFETNLLIKNIGITENNLTNYLMFWQNEKNNNYYIIECCFKKICIYNLLNNNELYAELISQNSAYSEHFSGIVYNNDDVDFLLVCTNNGYIEMWDLFKKILSLSININGSKLMDIIQWNNKYIIASDYENQCIKIIDITQMKIIGNYSGEGIISVKKIKKINNPKYGQGILSSGYDNKIKLWTL